MKRSVIASLTLAALLALALPAFADLIMAKPELPLGYTTWPVTLTASCKINNSQIKLSVWARGEDSGMPLSPRINKSARAVIAVNVNGKAEMFAQLSTEEMDRPSVGSVGDLYFRVKEGWMRISIMSDSRAEEALKKFFEKIGIVPERSLDETLENLTSQCLGGAVRKK